MDKSLNFPENSQLFALYLEMGGGGGKIDMSIRSVHEKRTCAYKGEGGVKKLLSNCVRSLWMTPWGSIGGPLHGA